MKFYLVGGAVRDELLGLNVQDHDWVVVGATPEAMLKAGYKQVGKDFPVFLHPDTQEEYALARTERKTGRGYYGFECRFSPDVSLEDDLKRRDLTINAMAKSKDGELIDPFHGADDLKNKVLRHVSEAFVEDPVRILRVARFYARYAPLGFTVADETLALMQQMVANGEIEHLVPERVWSELVRALAEPEPVAFIRLLKQMGALKVILPEVDALYGVPQRKDYHPEIDTGVHTEMVLQQACLLSPDAQVRFAALVHDLGKALTPQHVLPGHAGHDEAGVPLVKALCERLKIPNEFRDLGVMVARYHIQLHRCLELKPTTVVKLLEKLDAFRKPDRFKRFLLACTADAKGRLGKENTHYVQAEWFGKALETAQAVDIKPILALHSEGVVIKQKIHQARVAAIKTLAKPEMPEH